MENTDPIKESNVAEPFDVFLWANEIDEVKNNVSAELFLFNKNYTFVFCKDKSPLFL